MSKDFVVQLLGDWETELLEVRSYFPRKSADLEGRTRMVMALSAIANKAAFLDRKYGYLVCGARDDRVVVGLEPDDGDRKILSDRLLALTDPTVAFSVVSSGAPPVTSITSEICPTCNWKSMRAVC